MPESIASQEVVLSKLIFHGGNGSGKATTSQCQLFPFQQASSAHARPDRNRYLPDRLPAMLFELLKVHKFQSRNVSGLKMHLRRPSGFKCLFPPLHPQAPTVPRSDAQKLILGNRRAEVVADCARELQKLGAGFDTDQVQASIFCAGVTAAITIKPREWVE